MYTYIWYLSCSTTSTETPLWNIEGLPHVDMLKRRWNDRDTQGGWGQWTTISKLNGSTWLQTTKAWQKASCFSWRKNFWGNKNAARVGWPWAKMHYLEQHGFLCHNCVIYNSIYTYVSSDAISAYLGAWFTIACNLGGGRISATFELESENLSACFATFH